MQPEHGRVRRYLENVRRVVLNRLGRLSNDELGGDEDAVMSVMTHLGNALSVVQKDYNVGGCHGCGWSYFLSVFVSQNNVHTPWLV